MTRRFGNLLLATMIWTALAPCVQSGSGFEDDTPIVVCRTESELSRRDERSSDPEPMRVPNRGAEIEARVGAFDVRGRALAMPLGCRWNC